MKLANAKKRNEIVPKILIPTFFTKIPTVKVLIPAQTASNAVDHAINWASNPLSINAGILWIAIVPVAIEITVKHITIFQNTWVLTASENSQEISEAKAVVSKTTVVSTPSQKTWKSHVPSSTLANGL